MYALDEAKKRTARLNFRATKQQEELIRAGAQARGVEVSRFVLESACKQAEQDLADQRHFVISPERLAAFHEALDRPVQEKPRLRRLFSEKSILGQ